MSGSEVQVLSPAFFFHRREDVKGAPTYSTVGPTSRRADAPWEGRAATGASGSERRGQVLSPAFFFHRREDVKGAPSA